MSTSNPITNHRVRVVHDGRLAVAAPIKADALIHLRHMIPPASRIHSPGEGLVIAAGWAQTAFNLLRTLGNVEIGGEA
jgi:hypothetical protein